jgi:pyridoxamine 5'-phosphate oxidase
MTRATDLDRSLPDTLPEDPFPTFRAWYDEAHTLAAQPNPNAMVVATVDPSSDPPQPSARVVLCRGMDLERGYLVFFTNRKSQKGREAEQDARAAILFHWDHMELQVRMQGPLVESPPAESDDYWHARRFRSKLAAWASDQSEPIDSRETLVRKYEAVCAQFGVDPQTHEPEKVIPRPPHWGGYRVWAERVELWCGSPIRFHDRALWTRSLTPKPGGEFDAGPWTATRLQP